MSRVRNPAGQGMQYHLRGAIYRPLPQADVLRAMRGYPETPDASRLQIEYLLNYFLS